jgi:hypothetical protein
VHVKNPFKEIMSQSNLLHCFVAELFCAANTLTVLQVETDKSASAQVAPECLPVTQVQAILFLA